MSDRPTPETDAVKFRIEDSNHFAVHVVHARRLERERDEARDAAEKAKAYKRVLKDDNAKLRRDLDKAQRDADTFLENFGNTQERAINAERELDELNKRLIEVSRMWVDLLIEREDLRKEVATERALADKLARALDRMLHLHDNGIWNGKQPDERAREVLKKWKEARW